MNIITRNVNLSVSISLTVLRVVGFWAPDDLGPDQKILYHCLTACSFMYLLGIYLIIQVVDLFQIWGDLPLMTGTAFLLFTNLAQVTKILNILCRRNRIQAIIEDADEVLKRVSKGEAKKIVKSCNKETSLLQLMYFISTVVTTLGWASSAEKGKLPLRAWYPYNTSKSPAYELTYVHQVSALFIAAYLNVGKDTLVASLIAQCRCRLRLLALSFKTLCEGLQVGEKGLLTPDQELVASKRLRLLVIEHQAVLSEAVQLQNCFSEPTFAQFTVSLIIICVTAFQLVSQTGNMVRLLSMGTYLLNMMFQVFIYCYQGNQLSEESSEIAGAAYQCPWYTRSPKFRKALLTVMVRSRRVAKLTAGGFTTLSLASFMAIIKASYSLFTLLQQVEDKK
uniref:Odorant receptor n=1 Tax=Dendrolimus houi TaxID=765132 RepID=A0A076E5Y2_9NEOP|nr:odorant receptor [Dendrolimus houi]